MKTRLFVSLILLIGIGVIGSRPGPANAKTPPPTATAVAEGAGGEDEVAWPAMIAAVDASAAATSDHFGYSRSATTYAWEELQTQAGATKVFTDTDNDFAGPFSLDFPFSFYENTYTEFYINTNGMLSFGDGSTSRSNVAIPQNPLPNNYIAPLWTNLTIGASYDNPTGVVYYASYPDHITVEWYQVGVPDLENEDLTFEVILYDTGDIVFQYKTFTLPTGYTPENTVGIEDADGADGLMYLYDTLPQAGEAVLFEYPLPASRVKALPLQQGKFANGSQADFTLYVRNIGDDPARPSDVFNLTATSTQSGWSTSFLNADGTALLGDSDANGQPDTGVLARGEIFTLTARVQNSQAGSTLSASTLAVTAQSKNDTAKTAVSQVQIAIPPSFAQSYADNSLHIGLYDENAITVANVDSSFPGSNMSVSLLNRDYAFTWEINVSKLVGGQMVFHTNVEYALFGMDGRLVSPSSYLTDNSNLDISTRDRSPMMVATRDGIIGAIWYRQIYDPAQGHNDNIYFSRLQANGQPISNSQVNVTNNTGWRATSTLNVPYFYSPRIIATQDNHFILTWSDDRLTGQGALSDIWYAVYASDGTQVIGPTRLTTSTANQLLYSYPTLALLANNQVFFAYTQFNDTTELYSVMFALLNSSGQVEKTQTAVTNAAGTHADAVQLAGGQVFLAWTDIAKAQIGYVLLDGSTFAATHGSTLVTNPDTIPRPADYVSVTPGRQGGGILTWMDGRWNTHLYYAEIDEDGAFQIVPMIFLTTLSPSTLLQTSFTGYGNAPRLKSTFIPLISR